MSDNMASRMKRNLSAKNVTAMILFGAIILVFVFFGLPNRLRGGFGAAARVNETFISLLDYQHSVEQLEQMYAQYMGGQPLDPRQQADLRDRALDRLIYGELTAQAARRNGIRAADVEIRNFITKDVPAFQKDGQFQREFYTNYLSSNSVTAGEFENKIRKQIEAERVRRLFESSSRTLSLEAEKQKSLQNYKMNLQFVKFSDDAPPSNLVSNDDVKKALSSADFKKKVENEFNLKKSQLSQKDEVRAQHILIAFKQGDSASEQAALTKIQDLKKRSAKEDFGALAAKNSDDPGSKSKKGDLGFFGHGSMVKEFDEAAFQLKTGQISEPVKTPYGYHLIKVTDRHSAKEAQLSEHETNLAREILAKEKWQKKSQDLEASLKDPKQVEADVKDLGVKWEETGDFPLAAAVVPKIPELEVEKVAGLTPQEPYLKTFVRSGPSRYLVKLKDLKQAPAAEAPKADDVLQRRRADGLFTAWLEDFRKSSDIEKNDQINVR